MRDCRALLRTLTWLQAPVSDWSTIGIVTELGNDARVKSPIALTRTGPSFTFGFNGEDRRSTILSLASNLSCRI